MDQNGPTLITNLPTIDQNGQKLVYQKITRNLLTKQTKNGPTMDQQWTKNGPKWNKNGPQMNHK